MSKAEKFIQNYTRNCSNELCAVEDRFGKKIMSYHEWLTPDQARKAVEIAREELIEKAVKFLDDNLYDYSEDSDRGMWGDVHATIEFDTVERFIEQFKQAME